MTDRRVWRTIVLAVSAAVAGAACHHAARPSRAVAPVAPDTAAIDTLLAHVWRVGAGRGPTRAAVLRHVGAPDSTVVTAYRNAAWPGIDSIARVWYPSFEYAYVVTRDHRDLLASVTLFGASDTLPGSIVVGRTTARRLRDLLDHVPTVSHHGKTTTFVCDLPWNGGDDQIEFVIVADTLRRVHWRPWID